MYYYLRIIVLSVLLIFIVGSRQEKNIFLSVQILNKMNEKITVFCCLKNSVATSKYCFYALMFSENSIFSTLLLLQYGDSIFSTTEKVKKLGRDA